MPVITPAAARKQIAAGTIAPVYLLVGDDEHEIDALVDLFTGLVEEGLRAFNVERVYAPERGGQPDAQATDAARVLPMLAARRVVFLMRAERILKQKRKSEAEEAQEAEAGPDRAAALLSYLAAPEPLSTLVVVAADVSKTLRAVKALYKQAAVVECWGLKSERVAKGWELAGIRKKAEAWIRTAAEASGQPIDAEAVRLLAERAGPDISRLRADVERLQLYAGERRRITRADAEAVLGAEVSHDAWAVTDAIGSGATAAALHQLALLLDAGAVPYMVLGQLGWFVREKLPQRDPRRVPDAVRAVFRTDLDLKSSGGDARVLLERLVVELCAGAGPQPEPALGRRSGRR